LVAAAALVDRTKLRIFSFSSNCLFAGFFFVNSFRLRDETETREESVETREGCGSGSNKQKKYQGNEEEEEAEKIVLS
jgi:hypothetical protein